MNEDTKDVIAFFFGLCGLAGAGFAAVVLERDVPEWWIGVCLALIVGLPVLRAYVRVRYGLDPDAVGDRRGVREAVEGERRDAGGAPRDAAANRRARGGD